MSDHPERSISSAVGAVKWFDTKKGFGFVVGPEGQDIFVHYTKIEGEGYRVLKDGSRVEYDATLSPKGWNATRVRRLDDEGEVVVPRRRAHARSPRR